MTYTIEEAIKKGVAEVAGEFVQVIEEGIREFTDFAPTPPQQLAELKRRLGDAMSVWVASFVRPILEQTEARLAATENVARGMASAALSATAGDADLRTAVTTLLAAIDRRENHRYISERAAVQAALSSPSQERGDVVELAAVTIARSLYENTEAFEGTKFEQANTQIIEAFMEDGRPAANALAATGQLAAPSQESDAGAMREACAKIAATQARLSLGCDYDVGWVRAAKMIEQKIRALPLAAAHSQGGKAVPTLRCDLCSALVIEEQCGPQADENAGIPGGQ